MKGLILFALIATGFIACAQSHGDLSERQEMDVTKQFLKTYEGKFVEPDFQESFVISPDGSISRLQKRQVGSNAEGSKVPYPTVCSYMSRGRVKSVVQRSDADRSRYMDFATHLISVEYDSVELMNETEPGKAPDPNCTTWINERNADIAKHGPLPYSYHTELLDASSFRIQTAGGADYIKGGPRTPSTLDEVHSRVK